MSPPAISSCPAWETRLALLASRERCVRVHVCVRVCEGLLSMVQSVLGSPQVQGQAGGRKPLWDQITTTICRCGFLGRSLCPGALPAILHSSVWDWGF